MAVPLQLVDRGVVHLKIHGLIQLLKRKLELAGLHQGGHFRQKIVKGQGALTREGQVDAAVLGAPT